MNHPSAFRLLRWFCRTRVLWWRRCRFGYVALEWKAANLWVGAYVAQAGVSPTMWAKGYHACDVWICLIPMLPVHVRIVWREAMW